MVRIINSPSQLSSRAIRLVLPGHKKCNHYVILLLGMKFAEDLLSVRLPVPFARDG